MRPRVRAILLVAAVVLVVSGLLVAGPVHSVLHGAGDGQGCDSCAIQVSPHGVEPPGLGPPRLAGLAVELAPATPTPSAPRLLPPARGPPRRAG